MATQEIVEHLQLDPDAEEAVDDDLWLVRQIARVLKLYALGWLLYSTDPPFFLTEFNDSCAPST